MCWWLVDIAAVVFVAVLVWFRWDSRTRRPMATERKSVMRTIITKSGGEWMTLDSATVIVTVSDEEYSQLCGKTAGPLEFPMKRREEPVSIPMHDRVIEMQVYTTDAAQASITPDGHEWYGDDGTRELVTHEEATRRRLLYERYSCAYPRDGGMD